MILQILNVFYDVYIKERDVNVNELKKKISNTKIKEIITKSSTELKKSKEIRDGFTHRFPVNQPDLRPSYFEKDKSIGLRAGYAKIMESELIMIDIFSASFVLTDFVNTLRKEMKIK